MSVVALTRHGLRMTAAAWMGKLSGRCDPILAHWYQRSPLLHALSSWHGSLDQRIADLVKIFINHFKCVRTFCPIQEPRKFPCREQFMLLRYFLAVCLAVVSSM